MQNDIDKILADLYEADPSLRQHDASLRKLVLELVELRPNAQMDEAFRQDLRRKLMAMSETQGLHKHSSLINTFMKNFQFVGAAVAVFALLVAGAWYLNGVNSGPGNFTSMLSTPQINQQGANAFGSLASVTASGRGQGGGGNGNATAMSDASSMAIAPEVDPAAGSGGGSDAKMIAPNPVNFNYVYKGEELALTMERVDVLKRNKSAGSSNLADFVSRVSLGLVDLNSFSDTQLQGFTFVEDRDRGYQVTVQMNEGTIYINENWEKWQSLTCPAMFSSERFAGCPEPKRLKPEDVPADDVVIATANAFLDSHGISRASYGEPKVNDQWRTIYELASASDRANIWIPDMINVIYPLMINGQVVHDESGNPTGLSVTVRVSPEVAVSSVYDLNTLNYDSSSYEAVTDVSRVMDLVSRGGFRNYWYMQEGAKTVDVELSTPEVSLVKLWDFKNGRNEELLVPALVFPVTKAPTAEEVGPYGWYRTSVVIPLVKEILDNEQGDGGIRPLPMPLEDGPATEPAVKGEDVEASTPTAEPAM